MSARSQQSRLAAPFMNALLLVRFYPGRSVVIHNMSVIESQDARSTVRALHSRDEVGLAVEENFGIPRRIVMEAMAELGQLKDAWN